MDIMLLLFCHESPNGDEMCVCVCVCGMDFNAIALQQNEAIRTKANENKRIDLLRRKIV